MRSANMAILGIGRIADTMVETVRGMKWMSSYTVASRSREKAESFAGEYGFEKAYGFHKEMVQDPEAGPAYMASPYSHHYEHIKLCLKHGEHMPYEKVFMVNEAQVREVFAMAKERNLLATEAIWVCYVPMVRTLQGMIKSGVTGRASTVMANLYYLIDGAEQTQSPTLVGDAPLDVSMYALTFASVIMGDEIGRVQAGRMKTEQGVDVQNSITTFYKDGRTAQLCSGIMPLNGRKGMIYDSRSYIITENINSLRSIQVYNVGRKMVIEYPCLSQISGYRYEVMACVEAVRNDWTECPQMPYGQTLGIIRQMDEVRRQLGVSYPFETED